MHISKALRRCGLVAAVWMISLAWPAGAGIVNQPGGINWDTLVPTNCTGRPSGTLWNNGGTAAFCVSVPSYLLLHSGGHLALHSGGALLLHQ